MIQIKSKKFNLIKIQKIKFSYLKLIINYLKKKLNLKYFLASKKFKKSFKFCETQKLMGL